jgi:hypothetical protein
MRPIPIAFLMFASSPLCAGDVTYEIVDYSTDSTGRIVASGTKSQLPKDLSVTRQGTPTKPLWSKSIELAKGYRIGLSDSKDTTLTGFGMWIETTPHQFSWDWFDLTEGAVFAKLQEGGLVRVTTAGAPANQEIASITFLTDVSLRQIDSTIGRRVVTRVNIKKGSVLDVLP